MNNLLRAFCVARYGVVMRAGSVGTVMHDSVVDVLCLWNRWKTFTQNQIKTVF